jgi:hypothetical protein
LNAKSAVADVGVPPLSRVTRITIVAEPVAPASSFVMAGTSFAGESGIVNVVGVTVPPLGSAGLHAAPVRLAARRRTSTRVI